MSMKASISITRRITIVLSCSIFLLLIVLGSFGGNMVSQANQELHSYAISMADSITNTLADKMNTITKSTSLFTQNAYVSAFFATQDIASRTEYIKILNVFAGNIINENPNILSITLIDPDGNTTTFGKLMDSVVLSHIQKNYPQILESGSFDAFYTQAICLEGRLPYYAYIMPVYDTNNPTPQTQMATCIVLCDLRLIEDILNQQLTDSFCNIQICDSQSQILSQRDASLTHTTKNEETLRCDIGQTGWTIQYTLDFSRFAFGSQPLYLLLAVGIICLIMLIAIAITVQQSLAKPVDSILNRLRSGEDLTHMNLHFNNDLDIIVDTIEHVITRLETASEERLQNETRMYAMQLHLRESELSALQSQINPHFLYNTMECMRSIGLFYNSPEIVTISTAMTDIFRYSIKASSMVSLDKELDIIRKYLSIINIRFDDRFKVNFDISEETNSLIIPKMTLQPIVENAIYHGLEPRKGIGSLTISSHLCNNNLHLVIEDDGMGMSTEDVESINLRLNHLDVPILENNSKRSIGLINIAQRINLYSNGRYSILISSQPNKGTTVSVTLPAKSEQ